MGKSALTWKWFNDIAPLEMPDLKGRMWWSFYEENSTFNNFISRALAYVTNISLNKILSISPYEREERLIEALNQEQHLIVLDGLERILLAYNRISSIYDSEKNLDEKTGHNFLSQYNASTENLDRYKLRLRTAIDPRAGRFLVKLAKLSNSRILISTRLYPRELETAIGQPIQGSDRLLLEGLEDKDIVELLKEFNVYGNRNKILQISNTFGNYPLLLRALAGEIARFRHAPSNFDIWLQHNPQFDPFSLSDNLVQVQSHVLEYALKDIDKNKKQVLQGIAGFRTPVSYNTLVDIYVTKGDDTRQFADENELDEALTELEDRGLVGWDKTENRYDLHPIVKGVIWQITSENLKHEVYNNIENHFKAIPLPQGVAVNIKQLQPAIELYNALVGRQRYNDAAHYFVERLKDLIWHIPDMTSEAIILLDTLNTEGYHDEPSQESGWKYTVAWRCHIKTYAGDLEQAFKILAVFVEGANIHNHNVLALDLLVSLGMCLPLAIKITSPTYSSEDYNYAFEVLHQCSDITLNHILIPYRAMLPHSKAIFQYRKQNFEESLSIATTLNFRTPKILMQRRLIYNLNWLMGECYLEKYYLNLKSIPFLEQAEHYLTQALHTARRETNMRDEIMVNISFGKLRWLQGEYEKARDYLRDALQPARRGPYRLLMADAYNVLARVEQSAGNIEDAKRAAVAAYKLAWCDGEAVIDGKEERYTYYWGLKDAREILAELNVPEPTMPPFNPDLYEDDLKDVDWDAHFERLHQTLDAILADARL